MPVIDLESDPTVFTSTTRSGEKINLDVLELSSYMQGKGIADDADDGARRTVMIEGVRAVAWPSEIVAQLTDDQCVAFGGKCLLAFERAGNA